MATFPECPGYGFAAQPQYMVNIVAREGGAERVDRRWARPLLVVSASPFSARDEIEIQSILYFWHAMGGRATPFRFKDWTDYKSCQVQSDPTRLDQPIVAVALHGGGTAYQLVKRYSYDSHTQDREITQPDGSTLLIANDSGVLQTDWSVDEGTGLITKGGSFSGTPNTWGGEFLVCMRFNSELDVQSADNKIQAAQFTLCERRLELATSLVGS